MKTSGSDYATGWAAPTPAAHAASHADAGADPITITEAQVTDLLAHIAAILAAIATKAALDSPALTGTPTIPTAAADTNTTQAASTAYVVGQAGTATPVIAGTGDAGTSKKYARQDHVHPAESGAWSTYNPTLTQSGTVTRTVSFSRYVQIGRLVIWECQLSVSGSGSAGSPITVTLPVTPVASGVSSAVVVGNGMVYDYSTTTVYPVMCRLGSGPVLNLQRVDAGTTNFVGNDPNFALASSDTVRVCVMYEAA